MRLLQVVRVVCCYHLSLFLILLLLGLTSHLLGRTSHMTDDESLSGWLPLFV